MLIFDGIEVRMEVEYGSACRSMRGVVATASVEALDIARTVIVRLFREYLGAGCVCYDSLTLFSERVERGECATSVHCRCMYEGMEMATCACCTAKGKRSVVWTHGSWGINIVRRCF
jgi:hypothetical protein